MGRHKKFNSRSESYLFRMTSEEKYILEKLCEREGISKAEAFRKGLQTLYYLSKNGGINVYTKTQDDDFGVNVYTENEEEDDDVWWLLYIQKLLSELLYIQ